LHTESVVVDTVAVDKRFHFIPQANLLITVPMSNDRIVLRKLDLDEAVERSEKPFPFVTSPSLTVIDSSGRQLFHTIHIKVE
jgi:hypothetical protein